MRGFNHDFSSRFRILKGGKISLVVSALLASVTISFASPTDGVVTSGTATIVQSGTTTNITQSTNKATINWQNFSIAGNETVNFSQPNVNSVTLNRVVGNERSIIDGALNANGQVWILNSNGVLFNSTAKINTAGILATTKNISDTDFNSGNYKFSGDSTASVINMGTIEASDSGYVAMLANTVSNDGTLKAYKGTVHLVGASEATINLNGNSIVSLTVNKSVLDALVENKNIIQADGGKIYLTTNAVDEILKGVVNNTGVIEAKSIDDITGAINLAGNIVVNNGTLNASGTKGGNIQSTANLIIDAGTTKVDGTTGNGGIITQNSNEILQSSVANLSANSQSAKGGTISLTSKIVSGNQLYLSGNMSATGNDGGVIQATSDKVTLTGATIDASGMQNGGNIKIGGGWQGADTTIDNASSTTVTNTNITNSGENGKIVVWSDKETLFGGNIKAKGSMVEVSSKESLGFGGVVDAKSLLLDPKNIEIKDVLPGISYLAIPNPNTTAGDNFGNKVFELSNGNLLVTVAGSDISGGATNVGRVYLFSGTGTLISTLSGSTANDFIGSSVTVLTNGNFVTNVTEWDNGNIINAGAVTWGSKITGVSGVVSASNSLVGSATGDAVGMEIKALTNGNYVVKSYTCANGSIANAGAVTWGDGTTGISGAVSGSNSLVGSQANDGVGVGSITVLTNGNYVVGSNNWKNGSIANAGAVTWGNGATGTTGVVNSSNSLVGSKADDRLGMYNSVIALTNGNYVVASMDWDNGSAVNAGAVTWGSGTAGVKGEISASNSLIGSATNDMVGIGGITALTNGSYVVRSYNWKNGNETKAGAVTWGNGTTGIAGVVSSSNSLVGSKMNDLLGSGGIIKLTNGNYVVISQNWANGSILNAGAITWGSGTTGIKGTISSSNSLVGSTVGDMLGNNSKALTNGNYVVNLSSWDNGSVVNVGAVTWGNGTTGTTGVISAANSLVGSTAEDTVGNGGITELSNGNYVVNSSLWDNGTSSNAGAVTWGNGTTGVKGVISASNSLVGTKAFDIVGNGKTVALTNGNYVVSSMGWDNIVNMNIGAVTWGNGTIGTVGAVSASNSLIGSNSDDSVGGSIVALTNGNYVVVSMTWDKGNLLNAGAVTFGNGTTGTTGVVGETNSLVGSKANDMVGNNGIIALANGNYVIKSSAWDNGSLMNTGAVTFGNGTTGITGVINDTNSFLMPRANAMIGSVVTPLTGNRVAISDVVDAIGGTIYITDGIVSNATGDPVSSAIFATNPTANSIITPTAIKTLLDAGTAVTLQANNDITVTDNLTANNTSGNGGAFSLEAGRNININANIVTDSGNFKAIAGHTNAIATNTDSGTPTITIASGKSINAGTGTITLYANGGNFINNGGATPFTASLTSIYLPSYTNASLGGLTVNGKRYNTTYTGGCHTAGCSLPTSGVNMLYAIAPVLSVTPNAGQTSTYGDGYIASGESVLGFVNGDSMFTSGISGTALFSISGTKSTSGNDAVGIHEVAYTSGLASSLGYTFADNTSSVGELTIAKKDLTISGSTVSDKVYNANTTAVLGGTATITALGSDTVILGGTVAGTFANKNVGNAKAVTITGLTISGADAGNYNLVQQSGLSANITKATLSVLGLTASNKVYDGTTTATLGGVATITALGSDTVTLGGIVSGAFSDKNAGTAKNITITGNTISGTDAGNYNLVQQLGLTADITPKALAISGVVVTNKTYDGTTTATMSNWGAVSTGVGSETVTLNHGTASYADKNAGTQTVTAIGYSLADGTNGGIASNYALASTSATVTADITKKTLTLTGFNIANKTYDGTTTATNNNMMSAPATGVAGESLTLSGTGTFAFSDKNAGLNKTVSATGYSLANGSGGLASNYELAPTTNIATKIIYAKSVDISGLVADNKTYDGTTNATISNWGTLTGTVGTETLTLNHGTASFDSKNAGTRTATATGYSLADGTNGGLASNYSVSSSYQSTATNTISKATLTITANNDSAVYSDVIPTLSAKYSGFVNGETASALSNLSINTDATSSSNAGTYTITPSGATATNYDITYVNGTFTVVPAGELLVRIGNSSVVYGSVTPTFGISSAKYYTDGVGITTLTSSNTGNDYTVSDGSGGGATFTLSGSGTNVGNYDITGTNFVQVGSNFTTNAFNNGTLTITPKQLTVTASGASKVYDGNTNVSNAVLNVTGKVGSDDVGAVAAGGVFASKNVGTGLSYTMSGATLNGVDKANYYIATTATASDGIITPKTLTISGLTATNKTYDGTTDATVSNWGTASTGVGSETVTLNHGTASYADKNAGTSKTVTATGYALTDGNAVASNYVLSSTSATVNADITKKQVSLSATKTYDGTTDLTGKVTIDTGIAGETLTYSGATANSANVATTNKYINSITLADGTGGTTSNYELPTLNNTNAGVTITAKTLASTAITGFAADNKTYDGTTSVSISNWGTIATGVVGEALTLNHGTASFGNANAGTIKTVTAIGYSLADGTGGIASNYVLTDGISATVAADINKKELTISGFTVANKVYDGAINATILTRGTVATGVTGESLTLNQTAGTASFDNKNAGTSKAVTATGFVLVDGTGGVASNYKLSDVTNATTTADIGQKEVTITGFAVADKVYDGTATATISNRGAVDTGIANESLTLNQTVGTASFNDKNVGTSKAVTASNFALIDGTGLASNYKFANVISTTTADITKKVVTISGFAVSNKTYDGTTTATISDRGIVDTGVTGESLTLNQIAGTASFDNKNAGTNKTITASGFELLDGTGLTSNYKLTDVINATTTANITKKELTVLASYASKIYDGTTNVSNVALSTIGEVGSDDVKVSANGGTFESKNVGNGLVYTANGATLSGSDKDNYSIATNGTYTGIGEITAKILTKDDILGLLVAHKSYDRTTTATVQNQGTMTGVAGETLTLANGTALFENANAGNGKTVTATGFELLDGTGLASNYKLVDGLIATTTANINKKQITATTSKPKIASTFGQPIDMPMFEPSDTTVATTVKVYNANGEDVTADAQAKKLQVGQYKIKAITTDENYVLSSDETSLLINSALDPTTVVKIPKIEIIGQGKQPETNTPVVTNINGKRDVTPEKQSIATFIVPPTTAKEQTSSGNNTAITNKGVNLGVHEGESVSLVSAPAEGQANARITLSELQQTSANTPTTDEKGGAASNDVKEVRVALSQNSIIELINGGVHLPEGVDQEFYVIKADNQKKVGVN